MKICSLADPLSRESLSSGLTIQNRIKDMIIWKTQWFSNCINSDDAKYIYFFMLICNDTGLLFKDSLSLDWFLYFISFQNWSLFKGKMGCQSCSKNHPVAVLWSLIILGNHSDCHTTIPPLLHLTVLLRLTVLAHCSAAHKLPPIASVQWCHVTIGEKKPQQLISSQHSW